MVRTMLNDVTVHYTYEDESLNGYISTRALLLYLTRTEGEWDTNTTNELLVVMRNCVWMATVFFV